MSRRPEEPEPAREVPAPAEVVDPFDPRSTCWQCGVPGCLTEFCSDRCFELFYGRR